MMTDEQLDKINRYSLFSIEMIKEHIVALKEIAKAFDSESAIPEFLKMCDAGMSVESFKRDVGLCYATVLFIERDGVETDHPQLQRAYFLELYGSKSDPFAKFDGGSYFCTHINHALRAREIRDTIIPFLKASLTDVQ